MDSLRGNLLIASPILVDPNFHRTVVLIAEHSDEGAMGVVLNRPADTDVIDAVPDLSTLVDPDDPIWIGGPVSTGAVVIAEFEDPSRAAAVVLDDIGFIPADTEDFDALAGEIRRARVFAGHSGWGPGQLENELEEESWIIEPAQRDDVFTEDPESLWSAVLARKGRQYALLATMPADPSMN